MTSQKPSWLPRECNYHGIEQLLPELTDATDPYVLLVGSAKSVKKWRILSGGNTSPIWGGSKEKIAQEIARILGKEYKSTLRRAYDGLSLTVLNEAINPGGILYSGRKCPNLDNLFGELDGFFVRPEYIAGSKK